MKPSEIKKLIIGSMDADAAPEEIARRLEEEGISYDFRRGFSDRVIDKIFTAGATIVRQAEFVRSLNYAFYRVALTGVAAIVILLISIFMMEGTISLNSFLGLGDSYDESIVCLLTGN
jgi:hypothetical protein